MKKTIMKKLAICLVIAVIISVLPLGTIASAAPDTITVVLDGTTLKFDAQPRIVSDRTLVPLRGIFEAMGATVLWDGATQTVIALRLDTVVKLTIGASSATVNKEKRQLDAAAQIFEDRTFVPLRFVSESMGAEVGWDGDTRTVIIESDRAHWSDPGENLSTELLFTSEWVSLQTGEKMTFNPEDFIEINDTWDRNPAGLYYSYSETNAAERNIVHMFLDGAHLKDHYLEYDPETWLLSEHMYDDILESWHVAVNMTPEEEEEALREAHDDVTGYETDKGVILETEYIDYENNLIMRYPDYFALKPEDESAIIKNFPSRFDSSVLKYWVIPNSYNDTVESFAESLTADEVNYDEYSDGVIGRMTDMDQETGEITYGAYFWLVKEDFIACAVISCETEKQASEWHSKLVVEDALVIEEME